MTQQNSLNQQEIKTKIINEIIKVEGGYVNDPNDLGGQTNFGITEKVQRENGFEGDMKELPKELAFMIYSKKYWDVNKLDEIQAISPEIQAEVQDTGVNMGTKVQQKFLQRQLNTLNYINSEQTLFPNLVVDGVIGKKSIEALKEYLEYRKNRELSELVLLRILNSLQGARYIEISESRAQNKAFIYGWFQNRVEI